MAALARGTLRRKQAELALALDGCIEEHHRFLMAMQLERIEAAERNIATLDARITEKLVPYEDAHHRLMTIPGADWFVAAVILAELGIDMSVYRSAAHAAAWTGICPGNHESAGKRKAIGARKGNVYLKTALVTAAVCASRKSGSYLRDKYFRVRARRGPLRAAVAVAHKILIAAYHILATGSTFKDLGAGHLDCARRTHSTKSLVRRLNQLGYQVMLMPVHTQEAAPA